MTTSTAGHYPPAISRRNRRRGADIRLGAPAPARPRRLSTIRQGYQTNIWGMPTYYLMRSGPLEKRGIKFEEFAVPSGNLTMQQMVARQVDLGTYAGPSFILGHDKGGLVGIAHDRICRQDHRACMARKDLNITKVEELQRQEDRQPDRLLDRQYLRRPDRAGRRPQEGRLAGSAHERQRHGRRAGRQDRRRHGECRAVQCDRGSGRASPRTVVDFSNFDKMPVFMAATPDFVDKNPDTVVAYLKAWLDVARDFKENPNKVADVIYNFYTVEGLHDVAGDLPAGARHASRSTPASRPTSSPTCSSRPKSC